MQSIEEMRTNLEQWLLANQQNPNFAKNLRLYEAMFNPLYSEHLGEYFFLCVDENGEVERVVFQNKVQYNKEEIAICLTLSKDALIKAHKVKSTFRNNQKQARIQGVSSCETTQKPVGAVVQQTLLKD